MVLFQRNLYFPRPQRGPTFFRDVQPFSSGVQMHIRIETHITCDFPGGGGPGPYSPSGSAHELH